MRGTGNWSRPPTARLAQSAKQTTQEKRETENRNQPPTAGFYSYGNRQEKCAAAAAAGQSGARHFDQSQRVMANVHDYGRVCRRGRTAVGAASRGVDVRFGMVGA